MSGVALVTGGTGFAGSHLIEHLLEHEPAVAAWANPAGQAPRTGNPHICWCAVDLLDRPAVGASLAELRPSVIYHCAGVAHVGGTWGDPARALRVNVLGTYYLLEEVRRIGLRCPVLVTGSALVYRPSHHALREDSPLAPSSPYGLSKLAQEMVAGRASWCPVLLTRSFNHAGPRQSADYVTSSFARQIAEIEAGRRPAILRVGNLDAQRDLTDVRDTVAAYRLLVGRGHPGQPYNVCSGRAYRVGDLLEQMIGMSRLAIHVEPDPARIRPSDTPIVLGDPSRLAGETGWRPAIPIHRTLADLLGYWRALAGRPA